MRGCTSPHPDLTPFLSPSPPGFPGPSLNPLPPGCRLRLCRDWLFPALKCFLQMCSQGCSFYLPTSLPAPAPSKISASPHPTASASGLFCLALYSNTLYGCVLVCFGYLLETEPL